MSRVVHTTFTLQRQSPTGGRVGTIHFGSGGTLQTPALFPAICIMTGPPGFGRQGSHYKYIKRAMTRDWRHNHFLTEILHFTDYMASKRALDLWLAKPFQTWMDEMMKGGNHAALDQGRDVDFDYKRAEKPYETCFFLDSGGFKLLSNSDFSIEKFGYPTDPASILKLQTAMGGDIIASLDYPLAPVVYDAKALVQLQNKSMDNALWLLKKVAQRKGKEPKPLVYLAVHGVDYESAQDYTERLLQKLDRLGVKYSAFGFAVGSLVPRRGNRALVASIVKGVIDAIREHRNGLYVENPVHAFGMSGDLIPTLAMLGVDTFDTNAFVQTGKTLRYILPPRGPTQSVRETRTIHELSTATLRSCGCRACSQYANLIEPFKQLVRMERDRRHQIKGLDRDLIKSEAYAFLSMHNLEMEFREIAAVTAEIQKNTLARYVLTYAERANNRGSLTRAYEAATGEIVPRPDGRRVSLNLTRDSFTIPDSYRPPAGKDILLFLPCSKDKPYKSARSHQIIFNALQKDPRVHVVTISGLYGPVPEELEEQPEVMLYDYVLSPDANEQVEHITGRVHDYLRRFGTQYKCIAAYVTGRAYRIVAKRALKAYSRGQLLPKQPREQTSKEFLRYENVRELQQALLPGTHGQPKGQMSLAM